jgi:hypothetical protein
MRALSLGLVVKLKFVNSKNYVEIKIVQYIASEEFADGVKSYPAILNYAYRPYWEVDPDVPEELKTSEAF